MDELDDLLQQTDPFEVLLLTFNARLATEECVVDVDRRHILTILHDDPVRRGRDAYGFIIDLLDFISDLYAQEPPPQHVLYTFAYRYPFTETLALACTQRIQHISTARLVAMESLLSGR